MPIYENAPAECRQICDRMIERYHGPLKGAGVTIDLLFALPRTDSDGEVPVDAVALKLHGYPVAAMVKVNSYKLRVQGHADAEIIIDGDRWPTWSADEKESLIDHELEHLELKSDGHGNLVRDDLDRPKLRMRLHDHEFGWFDSIARRHGKASFEVQQYEKFAASHRQLWIDFKDESSDIESVTISSGSESVTLKNDLHNAFKKVGILAKQSGRRAASKR